MNRFRTSPSFAVRLCFITVLGLSANTLLAATLVSISVVPTSPFVSIGATQQFTATGHYSDGTTQNLTSSATWTPSNVAVGPVTAGLATANGPGVNMITASVGTINGSATLNVKVSDNFYALDINKVTDPWPTTVGIPFGSLRSLGGQIKWADIETCNPDINGNHNGKDPTNPCYSWTQFDKWFVQLQSGQNVMFTLYATPSWASSRGQNCISSGNPPGCTGPPDTNCAFQTQNGPGICDPPIGLNADGTGDDHYWTDFITALHAHVVNTYATEWIKYWEVWNEPNISTEWNPTDPVNHKYDQLLRMAQDAYNTVKALNSQLLVTTPAVANATMAVTNWLQPYLNAGGGNYADTITVHGYIQVGSCPTSCPLAVNVATLIDNARTVMSATGQQNKPLQNTEGSWGVSSNMTDPDLEAAFTAKYYMVQIAKSVNQFSWYGFDFTNTGEFFDPNTQQLTSSGIAYQQIHAWASGAVPTAVCSADSNNFWTCKLKRQSGQAHTQSVVVWDENCTDISCSAQYTVPTQYTQCVKLDGTSCTIANHHAAVGLKPIFLEN